MGNIWGGSVRCIVLPCSVWCGGWVYVQCMARCIIFRWHLCCNHLCVCIWVEDDAWVFFCKAISELCFLMYSFLKKESCADSFPILVKLLFVAAVFVSLFFPLQLFTPQKHTHHHWTVLHPQQHNICLHENCIIPLSSALSDLSLHPNLNAIWIKTRCQINWWWYMITYMHGTVWLLFSTRLYSNWPPTN